MKKLLLTVIKLYQLILSPALGCHCRFIPSCSEYAAEAINEYGIIKGIKLTITRLLRCHPAGGCGYDPVPSKIVKGKTI